MKNINKKESSAESDLEEGEIPEFEIGRNADCLNVKEHDKNQLENIHSGSAPNFGRMKDNPLVHIPNPHGCLKNNSVYFPSDKGRYELPFVEGEYVSEKSISFMRNKVPQNSFYNYDMAERRMKYVHPLQATYGSVEHIMTKIGETLGRSNDCYYRGKRSSDPRSSIRLNNIGATFRESGSLFERFRSKYRKKRRYSKSNSDSDREIWEVSGKLKNRDSLNLRRKEEKDFRKKRKTKCTNANSNTSETNKSIVLEKNDSDLSAELGKSVFGGNERLLKAIREIQERENGAMETPVPEDGSNTIPSFSSSCLSEKDNDKPASCDTFNSGDYQENRTYEDLSEKSSINGEDSDDDVELIKLRLLALTSNKRKTNVSEEEKIDDEKLDENSKSELTDDEKASAPDDVIGCKNNQDNDIDRYELMLRAEALKTALLKKHKHMIKRRKYSSCSLSMNVEKTENSEEPGNEIVVSDGTEREAREEEDTFSAEVDVSLDAMVSVAKNETVSESDTNFVRTFQLDNQVGATSPPPVDISKECALPSRTSGIIAEDVKEVNQTGKKLKRRRLRKSKKLGILNLTEISKKENSGVSSVTAQEGDKKRKTDLPDPTNQKRELKDHEKKFILVDSSQLSKSQSALPSDMEQSDKNTAKSNGIVNAASTGKIPDTEIQRIIVHLGSDSSDEEAPPHPKSEANSSVVAENAESPCVASGCDQSKILDYEKSVELLLKDARRRIEEKMETPQKIPPTPEAVYSHLAPSQRLEYIRLKQKIAETEKLRKMKENTSASQEGVLKVQGLNAHSQRVVYPTPEIQKKELTTHNNKTPFCIKSLSMKSNAAAIAGRSSNASSNNNKKSRNKNIVRVAVNEGNKSGGTSPVKTQTEGNVRLKSTVNNLGTKLSPKTGASSSNSVSVVKKILERKKTLTQNRLHLERLKVLWKNIKIEKMIEDKCLNELKRLKIQQNFFELKVNQQRMKIKKLAEESKQIYEAFQKMNKGLEMNGKKKKAFASEKIGPEVVVDAKATITNVIEESSKSEIVGHPEVVPASPKTKEEGNLVGKMDGKFYLEDKDQDTVKSNDSGIQGDQLKEYNSPLQGHLTGSEPSNCQKVDPNTIMCQYDLTGRCNDEECPYQHLRG